MIDNIQIVIKYGEITQAIVTFFVMCRNDAGNAIQRGFKWKIFIERNFRVIKSVAVVRMRGVRWWLPAGKLPGILHDGGV